MQPPARQARRGHPALVAAAAFVALALVAAGTLYAIDVDGDGLSSAREARLGTAWLRPDTDGDGLSDGAEVSPPEPYGPRDQSDPRRADTDGDGLTDPDELAHGARPGDRDTDGDGVADPQEVAWGLDVAGEDSDQDRIPDGDEATADCDHDGVRAALEADDDADGRPDADEPRLQRCRPDTDGDGVLDGDERAEACVTDKDCDADGLPDAAEAAPFSPLEADSLGAGLPDSVTKALGATSSQATPDQDEDGIPDAWESGTPPVPWGDFAPTPGQRDLLVEFVRVQGPDAARQVGATSFAGAYADVASFFRAAGNVRLSWAETVVATPTDALASFGLAIDDHASVLAKARYADHPYVNVVLLYEHIDQAEVLHAGVGQLRGMLAAVDYSDAFEADFRSQEGDTFSMRMSNEAIPEFQSGETTEAGTPVMHISGDTWRGAYAVWQAWWFHTRPFLILPDGETARQLSVTLTLDEPWLAHVLAHELGHNLGLCHTHESDCLQTLDRADRADADLSMMSYASGDALYLLPSEWRTVREFVSCPPTGTLTAISQGEARSEVWQQKYGSGSEVDDTRACGSFASIPPDLARVDSPPRAHTAPAPVAPPTAPGMARGAWTLGSAIALVLVATTIAAVVALRRWRGLPPEPDFVEFHAHVPPHLAGPQVWQPAPAAAPTQAAPATWGPAEAAAPEAWHEVAPEEAAEAVDPVPMRDGTWREVVDQDVANGGEGPHRARRRPPGSDAAAQDEGDGDEAKGG